MWKLVETVHCIAKEAANLREVALHVVQKRILESRGRRESFFLEESREIHLAPRSDDRGVK